MTDAAMKPRHIAILFHEGDRGSKLARYAIDHLRPFWEEDGHRVSYLFGVRERVPADLILVHVNLSVVPGEYLDFASRYPIALNAGVRDIRKSSVSKHLVASGDGWDGAVIAKSDLNYAGEPEREYGKTWLERRWPLLGRLRMAATPFATSGHYKIFESPKQVPLTLRLDPRVVLERFVPEIEDGLYHTTIYRFLGDRSACTRFASPQPIVSAKQAVRAEEVEPHPGIVAWRHRLEIDYGKLDYVVHEDEVVLLDINKTTGSASYLSDDRHREIRRHRAEGLYSFFDDAPR